jgi:hypothetical protein
LALPALSIVLVGLLPVILLSHAISKEPWARPNKP